MIKVVVIKFKNGGKLYYFAPKEGDVYERNMPVVVETAKGLDLRGLLTLLGKFLKMKSYPR